MKVELHITHEGEDYIVIGEFELKVAASPLLISSVGKTTIQYLIGFSQVTSLLMTGYMNWLKRNIERGSLKTGRDSAAPTHVGRLPKLS